MNTRVWELSQVKERGRNAFQRNYWWCVLAAILLSLILGGGGGSGRFGNKSNDSSGSVISCNVNDIDTEDVGDYVAGQVGGSTYFFGKVIYGIVGSLIGLLLVAIVFVIAVLVIAVRLLFVNPLRVGGRKFFLKNALEKTKGIGIFLDGFRGGYYGNVVVTMFVRDLKVFLWSLLLVIPGIIKAYEYRMVPYVLAEHPELNYREALERSSAMMNGQKLNAFVLDLSFIGWHILSSLTMGIAGVFWVNPYVYATEAELYLELSDEASVVA